MNFHPSPPPIANRAYSAQPDEVTHMYAHNAVQLHSPGLNHCDSRHNRNNTPNSCSTVIHHSSHQEIKTSLFHHYVMAKIPEVTQYLVNRCIFSDAMNLAVSKARGSANRKLLISTTMSN